MENIFYVILAILGLGFLVFIHELGHYFMAKKAKMKVEVFSIGFGKAIISWYRGDTKWQIAILPFGGYVKIAGMDKEGDKEPYEIKGGFFATKPLDRIKVSFMGPLVNIVFALAAFSVIWSFGGRNKTFTDITKKIGYVDPKSELYNLDVKPGDEILRYNNKNYTGFIDAIYTGFLKKNDVKISGYKVNYFNKTKKPYEYTLNTYKDPSKAKDFSTIGIMAPANYLISENEQSVVVQGLEKSDRILWANGKLLFSSMQLNQLINDPPIYVTVKRQDKIFNVVLPRTKIDDLKLSFNQKSELDDLRYDNNIKTSLEELHFIPYFVDDNLVVQNEIGFISNSNKSENLQKYDQIIAVNSEKITNVSGLFTAIQSPKILMIVKKESIIDNKPSYKVADSDFDKSLNIAALHQIVSKIGTERQVDKIDNTVILKPFEPLTVNQAVEKNPDNIVVKSFLAFKEKVENEKSPEKKEKALLELNEMANKKILDISVMDKIVKYNPNPFKVFADCFKEVYRTLFFLFTGTVSPKHLSGPVGIFHIMKTSWSLGPLEALYWLGFISINLGFINLLPIPVLDGGHIVFSVVEAITRRPLKAKTREKFIIPFVILIIGMAIFMTYHDIVRLVTNFF